MSLFRKLFCTKLTVKLLLFLMLLLTLAFLILTNSIWFPLGLVNPIANLQNMIHKANDLPGENHKANDLPAEKSENKSSSAFTEITITKISDDSHKTQHQYEYFINEPDKCKENVPFLVLLVTVQRWQREARQAIRNTWGKEDFLPGVKILRLFFLGKDPKPNTNEDQEILKESKEFHDIIQQDYLDTYNNLTIKVLMGLSWIATYCPNALYVMKTDSDMFVNTEYLVNKVLRPDQAPRKNYFTGYLMINGSPIRNRDSKWYVSPDVYPENKYPPFCSGTGYVLSGDLSHKIVKISPSVRWIHLEDVYIGLCLDKLGVQLAPPKGSDFNNWRVMYSDCKYHNIATSHGVSPGDMLNYWGRLRNSKHLCV